MNKAKVKQLLESDELVVGISELSKMTDVSPRQLRYWEEKGYISSIVSEGKSNRKYRLPMVVKVEMIKNYLDEGYTLTTAVEKARGQQKGIHETKRMMKQVVKGIHQVGEQFVVLHLADFTNQGELYLIRNTISGATWYQVSPQEVVLSEEQLIEWTEK